MAIIIKDLADRLGSTGHGTVGTDIFTDFMPESPDEVLILYRNPAQPAEEVFGQNDPAYDFAEIQIRARSSEYDHPTADTNLESAWKELNTIVNETVGTHRFLRVQKTTGPFLIDVDDENRPLLAVNMACVYNV